MAEYIVRETGYPGTLKQEIVQELVRCKDCRHFDRESWDEPMNLLPSYCLKKLPGIGYVMYGNGPESYCSYGERREDETD